MPHSEFLGAGGRWSQDDRDKAIAYMLREAGRCSGCGTRSAEWDPEQGGHPQAYVATGHMCPGCFALDAGSKQWEGKAGIHPILKPNVKTGEVR